MVKEGGKDPRPTVASTTLHLVLSKATAGALGVGVAARYGPNLIQAFSPVEVTHWQAVLACGVVGTGVGVTTFAALQTARRMTIKKLLTNRRWITDQKSMKTKVRYRIAVDDCVTMVNFSF